MRKRTAQKDTIFTDSQVNSNFPYRWSPASLTFNIYFYLFFFYLYMTRKTINNNTLHLKSPKNQHRGVVLGRPAMKLLGGGGGGYQFSATNTRPWFCLGSSDKQLHYNTKIIPFKTQYIYFYQFSISILKHDREQSWQLSRWSQCWQTINK